MINFRFPISDFRFCNSCRLILALQPLLLAGLISLRCFGEELPPVDVQVYFSTEDPHWAEAQQKIDAVVKKYPRVHLQKISIDDADGYKRVTEAEQKIGISKPGDITVVFGPLWLTSKGERRDVENGFESLVKRVLDPTSIKQRLIADVEAYAKEIFGNEIKVDGNPEDEDHVAYFHVTKGGKPLGWAVDAYRHIHCPICSDTQFMMAVSEPELKILDIRPVRKLELRAVPLDDKKAQAFLNQFKDRVPKELPPEIDVISGATTTSLTYDAAIRAVIQELKKREK